MTLGYLSTQTTQVTHASQSTRKKQVIVQETSSDNTGNNHIYSFYWILLYFGLSSILSFTFLGVTASTYEARYTYIIPSLLGIAFLISCLSWLQTMLSMNLLKNVHLQEAYH